MWRSRCAFRHAHIDKRWPEPSPAFINIDDTSGSTASLFKRFKLLDRPESGFGSFVLHCFVNRRHGAAGVYHDCKDQSFHLTPPLHSEGSMPARR
jgi:hypothetical protein